MQELLLTARWTIDGFDEDMNLRRLGKGIGAVSDGHTLQKSTYS